MDDLDRLQLELIADELKRIRRRIDALDLPKPEQK